MKPFENVGGKGENAGNQQFSPFPAMFSTHAKKNFCFEITFILSSANAFNLDHSKNLTFATELCGENLVTGDLFFASFFLPHCFFSSPCCNYV